MSPSGTSPVLSNVPCPNGCKNQGSKACSACRLVSYCSVACQKAHWKVHKTACKNPMNSKDWQPAWVVEGRIPAFLGGIVEQDERDKRGDLVHGCTLWGNTPAFDVVNLGGNENDPTLDLTLAFPASGDLRHVLKAVNSLPSNYSGKLTALINDATVAISARNLIILLILGTIEDEALAADIALHFWYSILLPPEYKRHIEAVVPKFLDRLAGQHGAQPPFALTPRSDVVFPLGPGVVEWLERCVDSSMTPEFAKQEYGDVRNRPSQNDYTSRLFYNLRPSHRVAFAEYRRTGIVLPLGASTEQFTEANRSLFMKDGRWFQTDLANPLYGWDIKEVVQSGKAHGATTEDIYGCLYFYLSDQLRSFHQRLRKFSMSFKIMGIDATQLSMLVQNGVMVQYNLPATTRFDRVFVSNILDLVYVGLRGVLQTWGPLLSNRPSAAVVGYFMNWFTFMPDGEPEGAERKAIERALGMGSQPSSLKGTNDWCSKMDHIDMKYDNSGSFGRYLRKQGLDAVLRENGLQLKKKHTIVPQRFGTSLGAPPTALPAFSDDDERYICHRATAATWKERFVEFSRK